MYKVKLASYGNMVLSAVKFYMKQSETQNITLDSRLWWHLFQDKYLLCSRIIAFYY